MSYSPHIEFSMTKEGFPQGYPIVYARTALYGLMYWHGHQMPQDPLPENAKPFVIYTSRRLIPGPEDPELIPLSIACCERTWNKAPDLLNYESREEQALFILKWLLKHGDIKWLKINGDLVNAPESIGDS